MAGEQKDTVRVKTPTEPIEEAAEQVKSRWINIIREDTPRDEPRNKDKTRAEKLREQAEDKEHEADLKDAKAMLAPLLHAGIAPLVERLTPEQPYKMTEAQAFADAFVEVGDKYSDSLLLDYKEEIALVAVVLIQFYPRWAFFKAKQRAAMETIVPPLTGQELGPK